MSQNFTLKMMTNRQKKNKFCKGPSMIQGTFQLCSLSNDLEISDNNNLKIFSLGSYVKFVLPWQQSWISYWHKNFKRPFNNYSYTVWVQFWGEKLFFPIWSYVETLSCGGGWLSKEQILSINNSITHVVLGTIFEISAKQKANLA